MIIALDTETYKKVGDHYEPELNTNNFTIGCIIVNGSGPKYFYEKEDMHNYIVKLCERNNNRKLYFYAANHKYDYYTYARNHLDDGFYNKICYKPFMITASKNALLLDTYNFYPYTVEELGTMLGYPKKQLPNTISEPNELKDYVTTDTEIVLKAILNIQNSLSSIGFTPRKLICNGHLAMNTFRTFTNNNHTSWTYSQLTEINGRKKRITYKSSYPLIIRQTLRGCWAQAINPGDYQEATMVDRNSNHPDIMRSMPFPNLSREGIIKNPLENYKAEEILRNIGVSKVTLTIPKIDIPYMPIRLPKTYSQYGNRKPTIRPRTGTITSIWTNTEIMTALKLGYKIQNYYYSIIYATQRINPLKAYIETMYELRQKSNTQTQIVIKQIMNNLSMKFSQKKHTNKILEIHRKNINQALKEGYEYTSDVQENLIMTKQQEITPDYANSLISSLINAESNNKLAEYIYQIPPKDVLYCDTDGLMFKGKHLHLFKFSKEMGDWKVIEENQKANVSRIKGYTIGKKIAISGVNRFLQTQSLLTPGSQYKTKILMTKELATKPEEIGTFKEIIKTVTTDVKEGLEIPQDIVEEDYT